MNRNIIGKDDAKSTKALENKKRKVDDNNSQNIINNDNDNELYIPLTEDNIDSYFQDDNYVQKISDLEKSNKLNKNE